MQGTHQEGEFRQLEIWTWKSYIRPPILHNSKQAETSRGFFIEHIRIIGANNYQRGPTRWAQPTWAHQDPQARPGGLWSPRGPPSLTSSSHIITYLQKKIPIALSFVFLSSDPRILISLLEAPFPKLFRGIVAWYVTPPYVQLVFVLVVYILNN